MSNVELPILSCTGCGACCHLQSIPPYMPTELDAIPQHLADEVAAAANHQRTGPCLWLNANNRCGHYEHRPEVCRQFELGGEDCQEVRKAFFAKLPKSAAGEM